VIEGIERVGKLAGVQVEETVASERDLGYRNKVELTFGLEEGRRVLGFHPRGAGGRIVDVAECLLQGEGGSRVLPTVRQFFLGGPGGEMPLPKAGREPLRIVLRESSVTGKVLVALRGGAGPLPIAMPFASHLAARHPEVSGVVRLISHPGRRGGTRTETLLGDPWIEETLGGTPFRLPAATFFQVNTGAAERLVQLVLEATGATVPAEVLDLYGGVGVFAIALARRGARATVVEADRDAADCGRQAANAAGLDGISFMTSEVSAYLASPAAARLRPALVVADPPRTGLGGGVAQAIARLRPSLIVLVSCDAPTLGRDLRALTDLGYSIRRVVPVDLFPQTANVEAVAVLERTG
jgi:23S rRNA (uracil-5-)-methyltransferase RumA